LYQTQLFRDSLRAALSLSEIESLAQRLNIPGLRVYQSLELADDQVGNDRLGAGEGIDAFALAVMLEG
jgi:hypothetical protein